MRVVKKETVYSAPSSAMLAAEYVYYTHTSGFEMARLRYLDVGNDIFDTGEIAFSADNGKTWSDARPTMEVKKTARGRIRKFEAAGWVDPVEDRLVTLYLEAEFLRDNASEGFSRYSLHYRVSSDGGRTSLIDEPVVDGSSDVFNGEHPFPHVWTGRNATGIGSSPAIVRTRSGHLVLVFYNSVLSHDGLLYNPAGALSFSENTVVIGTWKPDNSILWKTAARIFLSPELSTRGLDEQTIAEMPDGKLLLVMRGSNAGNPAIPGRKWYSISSDSGYTWSQPLPWTYDDGTPFYSGANPSHIVVHSSGKYFWFGNLSKTNPDGNHPRNTMHAALIDPETCPLVRSSVIEVDSLNPEAPGSTQLLNPYAFEDRVSGRVVVYFSRMWRGGNLGWTGDACRCEIEP